MKYIIQYKHTFKNFNYDFNRTSKTIQRLPATSSLHTSHYMSQPILSAITF